MTASGDELHVLGRTRIALQVGGIKDDFTCLVARELTQECIIGADFLVAHQCITGTNPPSWKTTFTLSHV